MARPSGDKTRCNGRWTEAKFTAFVKNNLRMASRKWAPIGDCLKEANVRRGIYLCACCNQEVPITIKVEGERKRKNNVYVDHIVPIIDPRVGWTTWDDCINRMFAEGDNLQVLCDECHSAKTKEETALAVKRRATNKLNLTGGIDE